MLISFSVLFSFLAVAQASLLPRDGSSVTVPLRRKAGVLRKLKTKADFAAMADGLRHKYNRPTRSLNRRQGSGPVDVTNENSDSSYSGKLTVGTPPQTFGVILDTGSSDLFLASTACTRGCSQGVNLYNPTSSSSFTNQNEPVSVTYGSGAVQGQLGSDTVSMGGFTVQSQNFLVATAVSQGLLDDTLSGLLGLGFKSIANTGATPLVEGLAGGSSFTQPVMSFYLERHIDDQSAASTAPGGTFTLGDTNSSLFTGSIDFVNIPATVTPGFWLLPVTGVTVQGASVSIPSTNAGSASTLAAIDTGTTLIGGPSDAVAAIYAKVPGSQKGDGELLGYHTYPCGTDVSVSLSFGGAHSWPINPVDFKLQAQEDTGEIVCIGGIFDLEAGSSTPGNSPPQKRQGGQPTNPAWIIGDTFLKNVYSVFRFNPPSVGFAQLNPSLPGAGSAPGTAVNTGGPSSAASSFSAAPTSSAALTATRATPIPITNSPTSSASSDNSPPSSNGNGDVASLNVPAVGFTLVFGLAGAVAGMLHVV